ncbi:MAG TPA: hypothetical protein VGM86_33825 [Thermoanaerobaculia bacterium]|jgi:hypothetical protein
MADSASSSDYKLDDLTVTVKDADDDLGKLAVEKTTFSELKSDQIFSQPPALSGSDELAIGDTKLEVSASATYQATAFVHSTDTDPDGVVTVGTGQAWLKAELALVADLSGDSESRRLGPASADAEDSTKTDVRLLDYRLHSPGDLVAQAVIDAIKSARFAVRVADVDQLDSGSRLAVVESGALSLTLKLSVADTLSASLAALDKALGISAPIQIQVSDTSDFVAGVSDDFQIVLSRAASGRIGIDVKKTTNGQVGVTADYGITVQFADSQSLATALGSYITSRLGISYTEYQKLESAVCDASAFSALPQTEQAVAQQVAATLGTGDAEQKFSDLKSRICGLDAKLTATIQSVVTAQLKDALAFTWSRMSSDQTVLSFEIDQAALPDYLHGLVLGDLSPALKALADNDPRFTLGNYLETRQATTGRAFGLSLSLGKRSINSQTDFKIVWRTETQNLAGAPQQRAALDGRYSYTSTWLKGQTETYYLDLGATMSGFAASPAIADFQFGLHLSWTWQEKPSSSLAARWAFAALAQDGEYRSQIEGLIRQLDSVVSGDPFSTRLLGAALVRYLTQTGQTQLFTTSASYKAGTSTTIAAAGAS